MNIEEIKNSLLNLYIKDAEEKTIYPGDILIETRYRDYVKHSGNDTIFDFSDMHECVSRFDEHYDMYFTNNDRKLYLYGIFGNLCLIEYFKVEDSIFPFMHQYRYLSYGFYPFFKKYFKDRYIKLEYDDISNVYYKFKKPNDDILQIFKSMVKSNSIIADGNCILIPAMSVTDIDFLMKKKRGIKHRTSWKKCSGQFPEIWMTHNNDESKNIITKEHLAHERFSNYSLGKKTVQVFCKHPLKDHKEILFQYSKFN